MNLKKLILISIFLLTTALMMPKAVSAAATLSLSPASKSVGKTDTFSIQILVNTTEAINTVTANLAYPTDKIRAQSVSTSGSFATIWFENNIASASGEVRLTASLPTPGTSGNNLLFATVNFVALDTTLSANPAQISFANSSEVYRNSDNAKTLSSSSGSAITITDSSATPTLTPTPASSFPTPTSGQSQPTATPTRTHLPEGGIEAPTYILIFIAVMFMTGGFFLLRT